MTNQLIPIWISEKMENENPTYERENAFAKCVICNGPIFHGEPVSAYITIDGKWEYVHRFSTWCDYYKKQELNFQKSLGVKF